MRVSTTNQEGKTVSVFTDVVKMDNYDVNSLKTIVTNFKHSFNVFLDNKRKNENVILSSGIMLDFDGVTLPDSTQVDETSTMSIEQFKKEFKYTEFFLYTSKSHQIPKRYPNDHQTKPNAVKMDACDRFHVFIPFSSEVVLDTHEKREDYKAVIRYLFENRFAKSDKATKDPARYFFESPKDGYFYYNEPTNAVRAFDYNEIRQSILTLNKERELNLFDNPKTETETETENASNIPFNKSNILDSVVVPKESVIVQKPITIEDDYKNDDETGNDYDINVLVGGLTVLLDEGAISYERYFKILCWAKFESKSVQETVIILLASNKRYNDTENTIREHMNAITERKVKFRTLLKMFKEVDPFFTQSKYLPKKQQNTTLDDSFETNLVFNPFDKKEAIEFLNSIMGYYTVDGLFYINLKKKGWIGKKDKDIKMLLKPFKIEIIDGQGKKKYKEAFEEWNEHPNRRVFEDKIIDYKTESTHNILNIAPKLKDEIKPIFTPYGQKKAQPLIDMLVHSICKGNLKRFDYLMTWSAYVTDYQKTSVILQIRGAQGTGKSLFASFLFALLHPQSYITIDTTEALTSHFNSHLMNKVLIVSEESTFMRDTKTMNRVKSISTGKDLFVEKKNQDNKESAVNLINMLFLTNNEVALRLEAGDRRNVLYETSSDFAKELNKSKATQLNEFWGAVSKAIEDREVLEYMQYLLQTRRQTHPIGWLSMPENQHSDEKDYGIIQSLDTFESYLLYLVENGFSMKLNVTDHNQNKYVEHVDSSKVPVRGTTLFDDYRAFDSGARYENPNRLIRRLRKSDLLVHHMLRDVYGEYKRYDNAQNLYTFDYLKVVGFLERKGVTIQAVSKVVPLKPPVSTPIHQTPIDQDSMESQV
jgi:DNA-directed RNA polymerase subunit F